MKHLQKPVEAMPSRLAAARQLVIGFEQPQSWLMHATERLKIVASLANLLMEAAGNTGEAADEENSDDER
ncbi:hypothetical protein [Methylocystis suflitae]|uniref:hypothetical protein n=1 Tax=Methylocystis suflitae TaxID=2951405 RepID=UPI00210A540D|nr:hypothetical protein [Methylocystis suflitae]MCQ4191036.1 hypothetical protein [Methylocystis suflitae]